MVGVRLVSLSKGRKSPFGWKGKGVVLTSGGGADEVLKRNSDTKKIVIKMIVIKRIMISFL